MVSALCQYRYASFARYQRGNMLEPRIRFYFSWMIKDNQTHERIWAKPRSINICSFNAISR